MSLPDNSSDPWTDIDIYRVALVAIVKRGEQGQLKLKPHHLKQCLEEVGLKIVRAFG